jgi:hypothetical protein
MKILRKKVFIGLMGVKSDGTLVTPSGKRLFKVPMFFAHHIQSLQHSVARLTHKL